MFKDDIIRVLKELSSKIFVEQNDETVEAPEINWVDEVNNAHQDWIVAQKHFEWATDTDLVDQAIYAEVAAQKRYTYLLKKAKESNGIVDLSEQM